MQATPRLGEPRKTGLSQSFELRIADRSGVTHPDTTGEETPMSPDRLLVPVVAFLLYACADAPTASTGHHIVASVSSFGEGSRHVVLFSAERVPADFAERVATLGGSIEASLDSIGVATVTGLSAGAAAELAAEPDVRKVEPDGDIAILADVAGVEVAREVLATADVIALIASPTTQQYDQ